MTLVSLAELSIWNRCRRRWRAVCMSPEGERLPPFPTEMTGEAALREQARGLAVAAAAFGPSVNDVGPACPTAAALTVVLDGAAARSWAAATSGALAEYRPFANGLVISRGLCVVIDAGTYNRRAGGWDLVLVRAATGLRGSFFDEAACLAAVCERESIPVASLVVRFLDKQRPPDGATDAVGFRESNLLSRARKRMHWVEREVSQLVATIDAGGVIADDYRCRQGCDRCVPRSEEPETRFSVLTLHKGRQLGREMVSRGTTDIRQIEANNRDLSNKQRIQVEAVRAGRRYVDPARLGRFLAGLRYPVSYLDFEAFAPAIPVFEGLEPFEHAPVVASLHRQGQRADPLQHEWFAASPGIDQRVAMFEWLSNVVGDAGSVVVFSKGFEQAMVTQLAARADDRAAGERIVERMVDLLEPFAGFAVYDPDQLGRVSLKRVLPAFTGDDYSSMAVGDGMHANLGYIRLTDQAYAAGVEARLPEIGIGAAAAECISTSAAQYPGAASSRVPSLREIVDYCSLDTQAMANLVDTLHSLLEGAIEEARP